MEKSVGVYLSNSGKPLACAVVIPSQAPHCGEGVETRRQTSSNGRRYSPDYKLERGRENDSEMHNRLVPGSSPGGPTKEIYFNNSLKLWKKLWIVMELF